MKDFSEEEMLGWRTPLMGQSQDESAFNSKNKIEDSIEELKKRLLPTDSLLDVGCFTGHLYRHLGHKNYMGVDIFPENIEKARRLSPEGEFICADLHDLEGQWDVVWCCRVLIHIPDFEKAARKLLTLAKRLLILVVAVEADKLEIEEHREGKVYFRKFSAETLLSVGKCEIILGKRYATVIYER